MKFATRMLRAVAVAGVATAAPLVAAMPAHAGVDIPQGPAAATAEATPSEDADLTIRKAGGTRGVYAAELPPGPYADIIAI